jgi:hypothetical protein
MFDPTGTTHDDDFNWNTVKGWFAEGNVNRGRNIFFAILTAILLITFVCIIGSSVLKFVDARDAASEVPTAATEVAAAPVEEQPAAASPIGVVGVVSVLPPAVEAGSEIKVLFDFVPADGSGVQDYSFSFVGVDKETVIKEGISPLTEFSVNTPNTVGENTPVGYIVANHKTDPAKSAVLSLIQEDTTAPASAAPVEPVATEPAAVVEPQPEADSNGCPARVMIEPPANAFVNKDDERTYSFNYVLNEDRPYDLIVPCGSTATFAFGNATINGKEYKASEVQGNVVYSTCDQPLNCTYTVEKFTPGHFIVTIVYPGMEEPQVSVFNAVDNMFNASNCGGTGCTTVFLTDADVNATTETFNNRPAKEEIKVNGFTVQPTEASVIGEPVTTAITVNGKEVGQRYALTSTGKQFIGVPESHDSFVTGLAIICPNGCNVYDFQLKDGESAIAYGNKGDGATPSDLNWTIAVQADDPASVQIYFIYSDDVINYAANATYEFNSDGLME